MAFWNKKKDESPQPAEKPDEPIAEKKGWLSRLTGGLSRSSARITQGIGDIFTKRKLDQEMLDRLEDLLIEADLGPATAAKVVAEFGRDRFGKDISEAEVREALAKAIADIWRAAGGSGLRRERRRQDDDHRQDRV
jgi:fused signal recognition particle receptor